MFFNYEISNCRRAYNSYVWGISGWFFPGRNFAFVANMYFLYKCQKVWIKAEIRATKGEHFAKLPTNTGHVFSLAGIPCCHSSGQFSQGKLCRRNDRMGFFFSPVAIILLQTIRTNKFVSVLHSLYSNLSSVMIVGAHAQQTIDQSQTWYQNPRWRLKVVEYDRDGFVPCLMWSDIFSLSQYEIKEIARPRLKKENDSMAKSGPIPRLVWFSSHSPAHDLILIETSRGMGPDVGDEPEQLRTEEMTLWDYFSHL